MGVACLRAVVDGPYIPDWEFSTLMGLSRNEARSILALDQSSYGVEEWDAVLNAANNLAGYPHGKEREVAALIGCDTAELQSLVERYRKYPERLQRDRRPCL